MAGKDEGESVFVDGVKDAALRAQVAAFLTALGLADPVGKGDAPQGFRCSGGGVLQSVADLMDERGLAEAPPLDREAAFKAAKEVSPKEEGGEQAKASPLRIEDLVANLQHRFMRKQEPKS